MNQNNADWLGLKERICVVTGAGSGIGQAVALAMASAGASVVLLDKDAAKCEATAAVLRPTGVKVLAAPCDIGDPSSVAAAEAASRAIGPCDILVNNGACCSLGRWRRFQSKTGTGCCQST